VAAILKNRYDVIFPHAVTYPEWHDNNGDKVKIETEKSDGLKARYFSWSYRRVNPDVIPM